MRRGSIGKVILSAAAIVLVVCLVSASQVLYSFDKLFSDPLYQRPGTTDNRIRILAIDEETAAHLARWKVFQADYLAEISIAQTGSTPVCCSDTGSLYGVDNFEHWWRKWRNDNGFPNLKFHELRHTQATQLLANGIDVKTVADRLGHANASITLSWYAHAIPEKDHEAAEVIGSLFTKKASGETGHESHSLPASSSDMAPEMAPISKPSSNGTNMAPA